MTNTATFNSSNQEHKEMTEETKEGNGGLEKENMQFSHAMERIRQWMHKHVYWVTPQSV